MTRTRYTTARKLALAGALALGGMLALGGARPAAAGAVPIMECPHIIDQPGTYVLAADLSCPSTGPDAIRIAASNVHLDLKGHTLAGAHCGGTAISILVAPPTDSPLTGVSITGGTITNFCLNGIDVESAAGLRISDMTVSGNGRFGVRLRGCPSCRVVDNRVSGNPGAGIEAFGNDQNARISDNLVTNNGSSGLGVAAGATGVRLTDNVATDNGAFDLVDLTSGPPCANTWLDNTFVSKGGDGAACIR